MSTSTTPNNVINLDARRATKNPLETIFGEQEVPASLVESMARSQTREDILREEHNYLVSMAPSFTPSAVPALDNPLLSPLFDMTFNTKKLRDVFYPHRKTLTGVEINALWNKLGLDFQVSRSNPFDIYLSFSGPGAEKIRKAYAKKGLNWIDCIARAAVELEVDNKPPLLGLANGNCARLQIASAN